MPMALIPPDSESGKNTDLNDYPSPPIFEQDRPEYHRKPSSRHSSTRSSAFNLRPKQRVQEYFSNRDWAIQRPIPMGQTDNYWIFDYPFMEGRFLFILRCPATKCQHPVFSLHPLKQDRAVKHLKACGQRFDDEEDIVKRYARQGQSPSAQYPTRSSLTRSSSNLGPQRSDSDSNLGTKTQSQTIRSK